MTPKQKFINNAASEVFNSDSRRTSPLVANSTPQAVLPVAKAPAPKPTVSSESLRGERHVGVTQQVQNAREALERVRRTQKTYGVPGAK